MTQDPKLNINQYHSVIERVRNEIAKTVVGQNYLVDRLIMAILCDGHILLEGVPGLAKTRILSAITSCIDSTMQRIQFTPDLLPSDLIGTEIYMPSSGEFSIRKGPIFTNLLLADEINRAPAKVQSALLQAMQEREVTIGEHTFKLPSPFHVLATQNPIEQEGTYSLPEAQVDRFLIKVIVGYPKYEEEVQILERFTNDSLKSTKTERIVTIPELHEIKVATSQIYVDNAIDRYIVSLVHASRKGESFGLKGLIDWGASPRASIALKSVARAHALLKGKSFVSPDDIKEIAPDVLRHRIIPSYEAEAKGITSDEIIAKILKSVTVA